MKIDNETVDKIARLAKLEFDNAGREAIKGDLNKMIDFVDKLNELDTDNVEPLMFMTEGVNTLREDKVSNEIEHAAALRNGPDTDSDYFKVPKVLEQSEE